MIQIELVRSSRLLTGRSLATDIVSVLPIDERTDVQLDLRDIELVNSSFVNQLFVELKLKGVKKDSISFLNAGSSHIDEKFKQHFELVYP